ncbi:Multidrug resistance-associated protein 1 isoform X4 [Aphelenchoides besseyi]|nr:Multidrug resistance-associated protein 1 isoform X4 [Aphelenchoides besseyi]
MDGLCDSHLFPNVTKNTNLNELFTSCFTFSVLPVLPFLFVASSLIVNGIASQIYSFPSILVASKLTRAKLCLNVISLMCSLVNLFVCTVVSGCHQKEQRMFAISDLVFNLTALIVYRLCLRLGFVSSGFLHVSWLLRFLTFIPITCFKLTYYLTFHSLLFDITIILELLTAGALVVLLCYPDERANSSYEPLEEQPKCPFHRSSAVQNAIASYAGPLLRHSFKEKVDINDFWQTDEWAKAEYLRKQIGPLCNSRLTLRSLVWFLIRCTWTKQIPSFLFSIISALARLTYALLLASIIEISSGDYPWWLAIAPAVGLLLTDIIKNLGDMQMFLKGNLAFYTIRSALISMIFEKMMRLSPSAQTNTATGVIMNYITVDVIRSRAFWSELRDFIFCPIVMTISSIGLSMVVGFNNMLYGMSILVSFQMFGFLMSRAMTHFTKKQMAYKDERLTLINDLLNGIKIIKLYGWEATMQRITTKIRKQELGMIFKSQLIDSVLKASFTAAPMFATIVTLYLFVVVDGNQLNPRSAFCTLFLFDIVRFATFKLPRMFISAVTTLVSLRRVVNFLQLEERSERFILPPTTDDEFAGKNMHSKRTESCLVQMSNASFSWTNSHVDRNLSNLTVNIRPGQLVGVIGSVGSGKSTLLSAFVGELNPVDGECNIRAQSMAYVSQQAWIQNLTLRDNIVFASTFDGEHYEKTLDACCLRDDIMLLPSGDLTEIGEKGINLSGGQKARVSLARAVYRRAKFYVLDDPFSALDANVGQQIFNRVIGPNGCLKDTTRIVALNSTSFLDQFDMIISLKNGKMSFCGSYSQLHDSSTTLLSLLSRNSSTLMNVEEVSEKTEEQNRLVDVEFEEDTLVELETFRAGRVLAGIYVDYIKAFGPYLFALFLFFLLVGSTVTRMIAGLYMANWSSMNRNLTRSEAMHNLTVYGAFNCASDLFFIVAFAIMSYGCFRASVIYHQDLLQSILRAPMSFFDKTPIGRIVNRFSLDIELLDTSIGEDYGFTLIIFAEMVKWLLNILGSIPLLTPTLIPLILAFVYVTRYFNVATAQFRRIASNSMSHVCSAIGDASAGASSIRVYGCLDRFREDFGRRLNKTVETNTIELISNMWIQTRLDLGTDLTVLSFLLSAIYFSYREWISLGQLGLIVTSCVMLCGFFGELATCYRNAETEVVCIERLNEYTKLEAEQIWKHPPKKMPYSSSVEFRNVSLRYREQDAVVLHNVSFSVKNGERIGIVGRTGAGKTSISSVLFRLVEPFEGEVLIGNVNIKDLGPKLRQVLTIIPQDPVLFCGNLRSNLDPFEEYDDTQLWSALQKAHLADFVQSLTDGLDYEIADGGSNLSVGQRQLVCLARALLRTTSILVLDEATAAVDLKTDALVQETIRKYFSHCTVLTIAHRLHTILDYDRVLVMQSGRVCEFDTPKTLLTKPNGLFREFAQTAGIC